MIINGIEPSRRVSSLLKGLFRRQRSILFSLAKTKKKRINWNRPPLKTLYILCTQLLNMKQRVLLHLRLAYDKNSAIDIRL